MVLRLRHAQQHADWAAANNILSVLRVHDDGYRHAGRVDAGALHPRMGGYPFVGSPEQVVETLRQASEAGIDGVALGLLDPAEEVEYLDKALLALLREAGLRVT